jgi:hypothetical protein
VGGPARRTPRASRRMVAAAGSDRVGDASRAAPKQLSSSTQTAGQQHPNSWTAAQWLPRRRLQAVHICTSCARHSLTRHFQLYPPLSSRPRRRSSFYEFSWRLSPRPRPRPRFLTSTQCLLLTASTSVLFFGAGVRPTPCDTRPVRARRLCLRGARKRCRHGRRLRHKRMLVHHEGLQQPCLVRGKEGELGAAADVLLRCRPSHSSATFAPPPPPPDSL